MSNIQPNLQKLLDEFADNNLQNQRQSYEYKQLVDAINASPYLCERLNKAVDKGYLTHFNLNTDPHAGASYTASKQRIDISLNTLQNPSLKSMLIFQLGHEIQHGFYAFETGGNDIYQNFLNDVNKIALSDEKIKDYSQPLQDILKSDYTDESLAMLSGWNAIASYEQQLNTNHTLSDIANTNFGYEDYFLDKNNSLIKGLTLNKDNSFDLNNKSNQQTLGDVYFKQPANVAGLGMNGNADYTNHYGAFYLQKIVAQHLQYSNPNSKMVIDMKNLGLSEFLMEQNGLDFESISPNIKSVEYYDKSNMNKALYFDDTIVNIPTNTPIVPTLSQPQVSPVIKSETLLMPNISLKHQQFIQQCEDSLMAVCKEKGITAEHPQDFKNIAAAIAAKGIIEQGMDKVEKATIEGLNFYIGSYSPHTKIVSVNVHEAVNIPVPESMEKIQQSEQQTAQKAQERQMAQEQNQGRSIV